MEKKKATNEVKKARDGGAMQERMRGVNGRRVSLWLRTASTTEVKTPRKPRYMLSAPM